MASRVGGKILTTRKGVTRKIIIDCFQVNGRQRDRDAASQSNVQLVLLPIRAKYDAMINDADMTQSEHPLGQDSHATPRNKYSRVRAW